MWKHLRPCTRIFKRLKNPVISTEAKETNDAFILHISSDCFAPFVALDFDDADVIFSDNFFHLTDKTVQDIIVKKEDICIVKIQSDKRSKAVTGNVQDKSIIRFFCFRGYNRVFKI